ncbi:uncharacterized protein PAC_16674 [Phialocephala subalpina]|uniref:2EXR domain-containing protein n=1 Tax=Phialocephala subalpina TaxID=576137 RepID=A0A1L7XP17_9HELO|nr:uncharacterized protein PAC_16674 [Phialocephala subalpina]
MEITNIDNLAQDASSAVPDTTSSTSNKPLDFSDLPSELKIMIWNLSLEPRILRIKAFSRHDPRDPKDFHGIGLLPSIASVCREWRAHFEWLYPLSFGVPSKILPPKTRFNGRLDTLFFREDDLWAEFITFFKHLTSNEAGRIRYLAFDGEFDNYDYRVWSYKFEDWMMEHMKNLERMTIVIGSSRNETWEIVEGCKRCGKTTGCWKDDDEWCRCMWVSHDIFKLFRYVPREKKFYGTVREPHGGYSDFEWGLDSDSDSLDSGTSTS